MWVLAFLFGCVAFFVSFYWGCPEVGAPGRFSLSSNGLSIRSCRKLSKLWLFPNSCTVSECSVVGPVQGAAEAGRPVCPSVLRAPQQTRRRPVRVLKMFIYIVLFYWKTCIPIDVVFEVVKEFLYAVSLASRSRLKDRLK